MVGLFYWWIELNSKDKKIVIFCLEYSLCQVLVSLGPEILNRSHYPIVLEAMLDFHLCNLISHKWQMWYFLMIPTKRTFDTKWTKQPMSIKRCSIVSTTMIFLPLCHYVSYSYTKTLAYTKNPVISQDVFNVYGFKGTRRNIMKFFLKSWLLLCRVLTWSHQRLTMT